MLKYENEKAKLNNITKASKFVVFNMFFLFYQKNKVLNLCIEICKPKCGAKKSKDDKV